VLRNDNNCSRNLLTSFECILRESVLGVKDCLETDERPAAAGDTRWFGEAAAAARGTENKDRKRLEEARRKAEANTLAVVVVVVVLFTCAGAGVDVVLYYSGKWWGPRGFDRRAKFSERR
jgi:hypothetical protein